MYKDVKSLDEFNQILSDNDAVLGYFSNETCNVCKVLKPQVYEMVQKNYPKIKSIYVDISEVPEISAQNTIFTIPTIVLYLAGKETFRKSRHIGLEELKEAIARPYQLMFS
ncbi:MAG: thioredoxin family protein [Bacteroidales bacterium]|nr:thioredoxin family protein [Bacteroidales bacterium]